MRTRSGERASSRRRKASWAASVGVLASSTMNRAGPAENA